MNSVETILFENIDKPNSLFIFPTDISASRWADRLLRLKNGAIAMNKFIAWDKFKQNSIKSKVQNKKSIPSTLRKIFTSRLVRENALAAAQGTETIFTSLIRVKWAQHAAHFAPWLTRLLPQLGSWFKKTSGLPIDDILSEKAQKICAGFKDDDKDMYILALRYAQFLQTHSLFEPAWETPPFNSEGKDCFLFFPESLSDYSEYKELLSASSHVKIINVSNTDNNSFFSFYYTNARREITEASLFIRSINEKHDIPWDSIVVCIPDTEDYETYVIREFKNRNIPYVKRTSKPLSDYPAGRFFSSILECTSQDYSFSSLVSLLTNKNLPWKDTDTIDNLIQFGIKNNCLYSWNEKTPEKEQHINVWEDAFSKPIESYENQTKQFFYNLKGRLSALKAAKNFADLRKNYFIFREIFFDMDKCTEETDLILSRCISELMNLVELEQSFPDVPAVDPFLFFIESLNDINYLAKTTESGVSILPYKTAAASPFDCHIVLGAGQNNLSVVYTHLDFLPRKKREELGIFDEDASQVYINLHKLNSTKIAAFFCSEHTFSGYTIAHPKIAASSRPKESYVLDPEYESYFSNDLYKCEFSDDNPVALHENQKTGFDEWENRRYEAEKTSESPAADKTWDYIPKKDKQSVSASALKTYYECSLKWLYENILGLNNVQIETSLMAENISGIVYHYALELFLSKLGDTPLLKPEITESGPALPSAYEKLLQNCINEIFENFSAVKTSSLSARFLQAGRKLFLFNLTRCLAQFLSLFNGAVVANCEKWYQIQKDTYVLNGKLDCILKDENGKYIIVDFKMASLPKRAECISEDDEILSDFQLPMYITLVEENEKTEVHTALFYSILNLKAEVIIGSVHDLLTDINYPKKDEDIINKTSEIYKQLFNNFSKKVQQFAEETKSGNFTAIETDTNVCYACRFNSVCRKAYVIKKETF